MKDLSTLTLDELMQTTAARMAVPVSGSGGSVIVNCGVVDGPGGVWRGLPSLAWGWSNPVSLVRGSM